MGPLPMATKTASRYGELAKLAADAVPAPATAVPLNPDYANREAWKWKGGQFAVKLPLIMAALGIAGRAGLGAMHLFRDSDDSSMPPVEEDEGAPVALVHGSWPWKRKSPQKQAAEGDPTADPSKVLEGLYSSGRIAKSTLSALADPIYRYFSHSPQSEPMSVGGIAKGNTAGPDLGLFSTPQAWMGLPLGAAGLYGGWKATDWLLDKRRKVQQDDELAAAKAKYEQLARHILAQTSGQKSASDGLCLPKQAGIFWKKLDEPVGIKNMYELPDHPGLAHSIRLDAERTAAPRALTRLFSSPEHDYALLRRFIGEDGTQEERANPMYSAMVASQLLPKLWPGRYQQEGQSPMGNEDVFARTLLEKSPKSKTEKSQKKSASDGEICTVCKEPWSECHGRHGSKPCACGSGKPRNQCTCRGGTPDKEASALLDDLAEAATKSAGLGETISEAPSGLLGALLSLGAITSLGAGKASYDHFTRYSDEAMMREALKRRAKQQMQVRPAPVELVGPPEENA